MPPSSRILAALLLMALLPAALVSAPNVEVVRVFTGWHSAGSFHRVSEYLGGKENTGGIIVLTTQKSDRSGYYWLVRLDNKSSQLAGGRFELQVISPSAPEAKTYSFAADIPSGGAVFQLGLTGPDWPGPKSRPAAWRLCLLAADGSTVFTRESFLWEPPPKK
jgi:hypothetical protein